MKIQPCRRYSAIVLLLFFLLAFPQSLDAAEANPRIGLRFVADGYVSPIALVSVPDNSGRVFIVDQIGIINLVSRDGATVFMDLQSQLVKLNRNAFDERGLLGLALHPKFPSNRKFYVYYSAPLRAGAPKGWDHTSHISEFTANAGLAGVDLASERLLLEFDEPQSNHNGGRICFGPDGFLYIGVGDGGGANDVGRGHEPQSGNGQDLTTLLAKILRIDVDGGKPYGIPRDNPFASGGIGRPEIFALGLRNPWGISFDRGGKRELFAADVGQGSFEEVNIIVKGGNYGWRIREGFACFDPNKPLDPPADCPKVGARGEPLLDPILAYKNLNRFRDDPEAAGTSITGGYVYRGSAIPALQGKYVFADWSRNWGSPEGVMFVATPPSASGGKWSMAPLELTTNPRGRVASYIVALGENAEGELYVMTNDSNSIKGKTGRVYKIVPM